MPLDEAGGGAGEKHGAWLRLLLHSRGQVGRFADRGVVHSQVAANGANHDLAGVHADTDAQYHAGLCLHLARVPGNRRLHLQGGVTGAKRVIFVRDRSPEERHDAVAHDLVHRALVAMDRFHEAFEHGVQELAGVFRIAIGEEFQRAAKVRENDRDMLALALERHERREEGRGRGLAGGGERVTAGGAEPAGENVGVAACRAQGGNPSAARSAEGRSGWIGLETVRALH